MLDRRQFFARIAYAFAGTFVARWLKIAKSQPETVGINFEDVRDVPSVEPGSKREPRARIIKRGTPEYAEYLKTREPWMRAMGEPERVILQESHTRFIPQTYFPEGY